MPSITVPAVISNLVKSAENAGKKLVNAGVDAAKSSAISTVAGYIPVVGPAVQAALDKAKADAALKASAASAANAANAAIAAQQAQHDLDLQATARAAGEAQASADQGAFAQLMALMPGSTPSPASSATGAISSPLPIILFVCFVVFLGVFFMGRKA